MDEPNLPRDVLERLERRWAATLSHQAALRPGRLREVLEAPRDSTGQPPESKSGPAKFEAA